MKKICFGLLGLFFSLSSPLHASEMNDYKFNPGKMVLDLDAIYLISSFEEYDQIAVYSYEGEFLWYTNFNAKITTWQIDGNNIFIFSKDRSVDQTYLTCLDRTTGKLLWEKP